MKTLEMPTCHARETVAQTQMRLHRHRARLKLWSWKRSPGRMKSMNPRAESLEHLRWGSKTSKRKTAGRLTGGLPSGVVVEHAGAHEVRLGVES